MPVARDAWHHPVETHHAAPRHKAIWYNRAQGMAHPCHALHAIYAGCEWLVALRRNPQHDGLRSLRHVVLYSYTYTTYDTIP